MRPLAAALLLAATSLAGAVRAERLVDGIAAQVGSQVVLISEVREAAAPTEVRARAQGATDEDIRQLYFEVLEQMIERALIRQVVQRAEIGASDAEVDEAIADIARENKLSLDALRASVEAQGMPYALYRERIRGEIEHARVINDLVASKARVEEKELREIYDREIAKQPKGGDELFLRLLVLTPKGDEPGARAAACAELDTVRARVAAGEAFEAVAGEVSAANPESTGSQAWVHESEVASWMRSTVLALPLGAVSERVDADFGCGLVQLVEKRSFVPKTFEQAKAPLYQQVFDERLAAEYKKLVDRLRAQTYIERKGVFGDRGIRPSSGVEPDPGF
jgi:peptidyl-prolyl cis-trans isomerase SurA